MSQSEVKPHLDDGSFQPGPSQQDKVDKQYSKEFICGSVAGMAGKILEHPFDTVKVRLQTQSHLTGGTNLYQGPLDCFRKTLRQEGLRGFYQGLSSPLFGAMLETSALFFFYHHSLNLISSFYRSDSKNDDQFGRNNDNIPIWHVYLAGSLSGFASAAVLTPLELIKCRVQVANVQRLSRGQSIDVNNSSLKHFIDVIRSRGAMRRLFDGLSLTLIREVGGCGVWFATYEYALRAFQNRSDIRRTRQELSPWELMIAGSLAGVTFNFSFFPADVLKSIRQTEDYRRRTSLMFLICDIYSSSGIKGFYRGLGITLLRAAPANAIIFTTYEFMSSLFRP